MSTGFVPSFPNNCVGTDIISSLTKSCDRCRNRVGAGAAARRQAAEAAEALTGVAHVLEDDLMQILHTKQGAHDGFPDDEPDGYVQHVDRDEFDAALDADGGQDRLTDIDIPKEDIVSALARPNPEVLPIIPINVYRWTVISALWFQLPL
ncbi:hypothetical protein L218DRAFT_995694 [Marasmius fiardii PR-910]|nr:hypothetical protein L218DRAFT_995694 [Marasmius fiardii PR-910]